MASLKDLEMAAAISSYNHINIKKSLFGLIIKAVYTPTNSPIKVTTCDYSPTEGARMEQLLSMPFDKMENEINAKGKPKAAPIGHFRLEVCMSEDRQFCAMQLFRFVDFKYSTATEPRFYHDKEVEAVLRLL